MSNLKENIINSIHRWNRDYCIKLDDDQLDAIIDSITYDIENQKPQQSSKPKVLFRETSKDEFSQNGFFNGWGVNYDFSSKNMPYTYTAAIIELPDGSCKLIHPSNIKFVYE